MKTKYPLTLVAVFVTIVSVCVMNAAPVRTFLTPITLEVPAEVLKVTMPEKVSLPIELTVPAKVTYASMKEEIKEKVQYKVGFSILNYTGYKVLLVLNGKPTYFEKDGKENGMCLISNNSEFPVSFSWFEKYGDSDVLFVGLFPLEEGNKITRGALFAVRFADLLDPQGNLRQVRIGIDAACPPLDRIRLVYVKPRYESNYVSPLVKMKPGSKPLVIKQDPVATAPALGMDAYVVKEVGGWAKFDPVLGPTGKMSKATVASVQEGSPYADAGLRAGMTLVNVQILPYTGEQLAEETGWKKGDIILRVIDLDGKPVTLTISAERLRKAIPHSKESKVATIE